MENTYQLEQIVKQFLDENSNVEVKPLGAGHINDSFKVKSGEKEYVLQRINHSIFKNVPELQNNILRVTTHIRKKLGENNHTDIDRKV